MYHFIVNPRSKTGHGLFIWNTVEQELKERDIIYQVHFTECSGHATKIACKLTEGTTDPITLVTIGGDGTINEVLEGICLEDNVQLGYIPTGSGNDFATGMHIPQKPLEALSLILESRHTTPMDVGIIKYSNQHKAFGVSCGMGFDAAICHEALSSPIKKFLNKLCLGKLTYFLIAIKQLLLWKPSDFTIRMDGGEPKVITDAYFVTAFNQPCEGGGLRIAPHAKPNDKLLDICIVAQVPKILVFLLLPTAIFGKHLFIKGVHIYQCHSIDIHSEHSLPVHRDGESCSRQTDIHVGIENKTLNVITPML